MIQMKWTICRCIECSCSITQYMQMYLMLELNVVYF